MTPVCHPWGVALGALGQTPALKQATGSAWAPHQDVLARWKLGFMAQLSNAGAAPRRAGDSFQRPGGARWHKGRASPMAKDKMKAQRIMAVVSERSPYEPNSLPEQACSEH